MWGLGPLPCSVRTLRLQGSRVTKSFGLFPQDSLQWDLNHFLPSFILATKCLGQDTWHWKSIMCQPGIEVPFLQRAGAGEGGRSWCFQRHLKQTVAPTSALSEGFSLFWTPLRQYNHFALLSLAPFFSMEGNWDFSSHVISSHEYNPEDNTALAKLMSVLPVILLYPPGWALPQQESGVASRLPACDPHMPRSMRCNINLLRDFPEQMRQSMECYLCLFFPPFGSSHLEWTE